MREIDAISGNFGETTVLSEEIGETTVLSGGANTYNENRTIFLLRQRTQEKICVNKNGHTYVNDIMLRPGEQKEIHTNDKIRLADEEFILI